MIGWFIDDYFFVDDDFWFKFEEWFVIFDVDQVIDYVLNFLVFYGVEDWSDFYYYDFEYEIEQIVGGFIDKL